MKWKVQYRREGDTNMLTEVVDVHFEHKNDVKRWWLSKMSTFVDCIGSKTVGGYRQDYEWVNCIKIATHEHQEQKDKSSDPKE